MKPLSLNRSLTGLLIFERGAGRLRQVLECGRPRPLSPHPAKAPEGRRTPRRGRALSGFLVARLGSSERRLSNKQLAFWTALLIGLAAFSSGICVHGQTGPDDKILENVEKQIQALKEIVEGWRRAARTNSAQLNASPGSPSPEAPATNRTETTASSGAADPIGRIREEGLNRSQVMATLSYLTDVIGPRLTGSPHLKRAHEWTRDKLTSWGLTNAQIEPWGYFGRGWSLQSFSAQIVQPYAIPLIGAPKAWSPGWDQPLVADVRLVEARSEADLEKYKGKLKATIVLAGPTRDVPARFEPLAVRLTETNLLRLANAGDPNPPPARSGAANPSTNPPSAAGPGRRSGGPGVPGGGFVFQGRLLSFLTQEGAALIVTPSSMGDGGTFFVSAASVPAPADRGTNAPANPARPSPWATNAPALPPQMTLAVEDYNRLARMIQQGETLRMAVDLRARYHQDDLDAYNTIAEIPGGDLRSEIVMIGAHIDSWHAGTGATDNGAGVAAAMEAVRILQALKLQPRRTIRIGLWSAEEQGLLGSKGYVTRHFGYYTNITNTVAAPSTSGLQPDGSTNRPVSASARTTRQLVREPEYERFSTYFNLDNGTGKIRGVHLQGNEAVRPLFRRWLQPFGDLGAETLSLGNTGGTDHLSFDAIGLPGFQFIQDPLDYNTRTHHSNEDVFDRIQADDMKQAATIMAAFLYQAATMDERLPRKPVE